MDATVVGRVSPEDDFAGGRTVSSGPEEPKSPPANQRAPNLARGSRSWHDRRATTLAKLLSSRVRLSLLEFPEKEAKVPVLGVCKSCSLVGPKIPFPVNLRSFRLPELGVTY
jgi:hypothetical protein